MSRDQKKQVMENIVKATCDYEVETKDGVKILTDEGWVIIRPSGTEPIFQMFCRSQK